MKPLIFCAFIFFAMTAQAYQVPAPLPPPPKVPQSEGGEIAELLKAQTNAIKALAEKVKELEQRIEEIEKR